MRSDRDQQSLSYPLRLPNEAQADALRLLDVSREVVNTVITSLWPRLDEFSTRETKYAYKQVEEMMSSPVAHGHRQWRCEAEQAGRILRGQAERKSAFALILPILEQGMIQPKTETKRAGKNRKAIKQALTDLREANSDGGNAVELQSLIEQACNFYLVNGCFPESYEQMQTIPVLKTGILPYAGDDGPAMGQSYRMQIDLEQKQVTLAIRYPDEAGQWARTWREKTTKMALPEQILARLKQGEALAPSLREINQPDGTRSAVLDFIVQVPVTEAASWSSMRSVLGFDWGVRTLVTASVVDLEGHQVGRPFFLDTGPFDGRQARTRRQIDLLKSKVARLEARRDGFPEGDPRLTPTTRQLAVLRREIAQCWRKYEARNKDLAHLAANVLLLLATASGCELIAGESLKSMKSTGRGRNAQGRWRNWRNNAQIRGELWHTLRYKCFLSGIRLEWQQPRKTSHTCPHCGKPADTYRSPAHLDTVNDWGAWLVCSNSQCQWNGSRDYAASLNIARLGATEILHAQTTGRIFHPSIADAAVKAVSYMGTVAVLRLPPPVPRGRLLYAGRIYLNGWRNSVKLRSSYSTETMLKLCG
ncbi:MAG TPA: zinc ribbon domain-containing protein [Ktedonobacteraceae bacterium]|nr:zinc ribbon domain-containing protein [Ktedonobacteraceae bacterium]